MFVNKDLQNYLESSSSIKSQALVIAELNLNVAENIDKIGNYRSRPTDQGSIFYRPRTSFDKQDLINDYTGATDSDTVVDGGYDNNGIPTFFASKKEKETMLFSLEDCFGKFRPRSGINKLRYFEDRFSHYANSDMARRPRYYMASRDDKFKYWTSYRTESIGGAEAERGVSYLSNNKYFIDDAAPFVVYKNSVPSNRIVVKMQTHIGDVDLGPFADPNLGTTYQDPFYGYVNSKTPVRWKIQTLGLDNNWVDAISFNEESKRSNENQIIGPDGYVEIGYGLIVPERYQSNFVKKQTFASVSSLPASSINGHAYLIKQTDTDLGTYYIWNNDNYESFVPTYGWQLIEEGYTHLTPLATDLLSTDYFIRDYDGAQRSREYENILGIRVVVETMNNVNSTFDLIEISPRLAIDVSDKATSFSIKKSASDLNLSGMPVGQLLASTGSLELFDYDLAFSKNNPDSVIADYVGQRMQFKFYDVIVDLDGYDYFVPLKTLYSDNVPEIDNERSMSVDLRDAFFLLETTKAPDLLIENASVSYIVSMLLDSIGFSNYVFKRKFNSTEPVVPYFFVAPDKSVADVLNDLARSTQTAMFFDEYNNFVMMTKEYFMPDSLDRPTDMTLYGDVDYIDSGIQENETTQEKLANIIEIASQDETVYNAGSIKYNVKYIQRAYGTIEEAYKIDNDLKWVYRPVPLWEVSASDKTKTRNGQGGAQEAYALTAIPLNTDLTSTLPYVDAAGVLQNNIIDFGEAIYWMGRYNGYFYANGEVIRYDAVEYAIPGAEKQVIKRNASGEPIYNVVKVGGKEVKSLVYDSSITGNLGRVWISSPQEYEKYFANVAFGGKIYPTGRVRIYSEPFYEEYSADVNGISRLKPGPVAKHGRGQFGTTIVSHSAGIGSSSYWTQPNTVRGCWNQSKYLFTTQATMPNTVNNASAGKKGTSADQTAKKTTRNGIIKNFMSTNQIAENHANTLYATEAGSIQTSALVMNGPSFSTTESPLDFISYVYKPLGNSYKHFGTRMRIVGRIEDSLSRVQTAIGSTTYYNVSSGSSATQASTPDKSVSIAGASGGLAVMLNPGTNIGYYFEIAALTEDNVKEYSNLENIFFYKIESGVGLGPDGQSAEKEAIPIRLWTGWSSIIVDDGKFAGMGRLSGEENPTVFDLAVEYVDIGKIRRFYLYINSKLVGVADDPNPLPVYNNMAVFVRGSARCMFENIYAIGSNYALNTSSSVDTPVQSIFTNSDISVNDAFKKYAMSGLVQSTYLSGISPAEPPKYNIYFEEFGTIMREAAYFNVKYDKAYPALMAKMFPNFNRIKGYTLSGFMAHAYGAEFLVFNATDRVINLDETSGNHLVIQGIAFNQDTQYTFTVDDYFKQVSNFSDPVYTSATTVVSPQMKQKEFYEIKNNRVSNGVKEFSIEAPYIQSQEAANSMMDWLIKKTMKPRKSIGLKLFSMPTLQLGDIVSIKYSSKDQKDSLPENTRFVVYNISYSRDSSGPEMEVYLSEVTE